MAHAFIRTLAEALYQASEGAKKTDLEAVAARAVDILSEKRLLRRAPQLFETLERVRLAHEKKIRAVITSKYRLSAAEIKKITERLRRVVKQDIETETVVDPKILGGFKVRCGDTLYDATLEQSIKQLARHLTTKE